MHSGGKFRRRKRKVVGRLVCWVVLSDTILVESQMSGIIVVESRRFCVILRLNCHCGGIALVESQLRDSTILLKLLCDSTQGASM